MVWTIYKLWPTKLFFFTFSRQVFMNLFLSSACLLNLKQILLTRAETWHRCSRHARTRDWYGSQSPVSRTIFMVILVSLPFWIWKNKNVRQSWTASKYAGLMDMSDDHNWGIHVEEDTHDAVPSNQTYHTYKLLQQQKYKNKTSVTLSLFLSFIFFVFSWDLWMR